MLSVLNNHWDIKGNLLKATLAFPAEDIFSLNTY